MKTLEMKCTNNDEIKTPEQKPQIHAQIRQQIKVTKKYQVALS
jgi:hypothetical protein